jgi:hypothetical protein
MPDYHNPAGRLLRVLTDLGQGQINREQAATKLGTPNGWDSILNALAEMRKEYSLLESAVDDFKEALRGIVWVTLHPRKAGDTYFFRVRRTFDPAVEMIV